MEQKITKVNWGILVFTFLLEIVLLNIVLVARMDISIYNELYNFIKSNAVCIGADLFFCFNILDFAINKKKTKDILKSDKADVNLRMVKTFILLEIVKTILVVVSLQKTIGIFQNRFIEILITFAIITFSYYILYLILPKKENLTKKIKKLKRREKDLKIILIDGNITPSSFEIEKNTQYQKAKNHLYMNINADLPRIKDQKIKEFIEENTIAIIHEIENADNDIIIREYQKQQINNIKMFHIMAVNNLKKLKLSKQIQSLNTIKVCDINLAIEFVENIFIIGEKEKISKLRYQIALIKIKMIKEKKLRNDENIKEKYIEELNKIYQYRFNKKLDNEIQIIPRDNLLFELYRNSYLQTSAYQSILAMFNYITVMGKMVEYYLYAKNNEKFDENKIDTGIIGDNPSVWNNQILINIYQNQGDILYQNLRKNEFEISKDERILLHTYLSYLLNQDIKGEKITFDGLSDIFVKFRNKVEAHGIISDANVYAVWNLTKFFTEMYNKIFKIFELECEYQNENIKIGYKGEEKVDVGKYIILIDDTVCFIKGKAFYIDYLTGETKSIVKE